LKKIEKYSASLEEQQQQQQEKGASGEGGAWVDRVAGGVGQITNKFMGSSSTTSPVASSVSSGPTPKSAPISAQPSVPETQPEPNGWDDMMSPTNGSMSQIPAMTPSFGSTGMKLGGNASSTKILADIQQQSSWAAFPAPAPSTTASALRMATPENPWAADLDLPSSPPKQSIPLSMATSQQSSGWGDAFQSDPWAAPESFGRLSISSNSKDNKDDELERKKAERRAKVEELKHQRRQKFDSNTSSLI
jgi:hypothetical protein